MRYITQTYGRGLRTKAKKLIVGSANQDLPALPTRVIDVGPPDGSVKPCLLESRFWDPFLQEPRQRRRKWIALSYCWGKLPFIRTTTSNIGRRKRGIPLKLLPRSFQDAIHLTRRFSIRYLWIDALCIIQNSVTNWQTEVMAMPYVYSNSYLHFRQQQVEPHTAVLFERSRMCMKRF
jgi:hypothetical protein